MYIDLLKRCLLDYIYGSFNLNTNTEVYNIDDYMEGWFWPKRAHTMVGFKRLNNIEECFLHVTNHGIKGDLVETGVWRGGSCIFMAGLNKFYNANRKIYVCDSFEGLPKPDEKTYPADKGDNHHTFDYLAVSEGQVKENFKRYNLLDDNVKFIKGFFEHSLVNVDTDKIAILRLDGDMYSSTIQSLDQLYHKVSVGGFIIVDDYGIPSCKQAITDFRIKHNITSPLIRVDKTCVFWSKDI